MLIPAYWAEARVQHRADKRHVTVRRFGWSDASLEDAQARADTRAREALGAVLAGQALPRRERKVVYNVDGAIREEIVERHGDVVVTRNAYGARCLNVEDVLFADIDFEAQGGSDPAHLLIVTAATAIAMSLAWTMGANGGLIALSGILAVLVAGALVSRMPGPVKPSGEAAEAAALTRIERFITAHPEWHMRVYRTPAGLRAAALHRCFDPEDAEVTRCFEALGVDRVYALMCARQRCFRARISPKPWRMGIARHLKPSPGVWPVEEERMRDRREWVNAYEERALEFAACHLLRDFGATHQVDAKAREVVDLHDVLCGVASGRPIA